jgi:voltage-dependent potassium channel beta subunit
MKYRYLGKSGVQVSELSLGSWITFGNQISDDVSRNLMHMAYDAGVNFFDNAEIYANGKSEIVMGNILQDAGWDRTSYLVSSKVFFGDGRTLPNQRGLSRKHIMEACHASLKRLQVEYIDLYFCHRPDKNTPIEETVWTMNTLIQQGKIFYWGTSEWSAQEIMEAHMVAKSMNLIGPVMEQPQYNMFHRDKMEVEYRQIYKTVGLGTTIWSPLASGILTDKYIHGVPEDTRLQRKELQWLKEKNLTQEKLDIVARLGKLAKSMDVSLSQLAILWCLNSPHVSTVILGASKEQQLKETLEVANIKFEFTDILIEQIESILMNKPAQPAF